MNIKEQQQWLNYWRRSLKDAEKADIEIDNFQKKEKGKYVRNFVLIDDFSPDKESIPDKAKGKCKEILERLHKNETDVCISPFLIKKSRKKYSAFSPFWYMAHIDMEGNLTIPEDTTPIVPRKYLSPIIDNASNEDFIFGDLDKVEEAIAKNNNNQYESYNDYIIHICDVFNEIIGKEFIEYSKSCMQERGLSNQGDFQAYSHEIKCSTAIIIFLPDEKKSKNAGKHILELYNELCSLEKYPTLLSKMIDGENNSSSFLPEEDWIPFNGKHLGQMKDDFPLSYSQRRSLYTILNQWNKPVHVVNGPPGTGKTTLLQSIVADMVVKSAIAEEPCIILGAAATNQAVTNIIESFSKKQGEQDIRWLPTNSCCHGGYGTYFPSSSVSKDDLKDINYIGFDFSSMTETGTFTEIENKEYLDKAESGYIERARSYFGSSDISGVTEIVARLKNDIAKHKQELENITNTAQNLVDLSRKFPHYWNDKGMLFDVIENDLTSYQRQLASINKDVESLKKSEQESLITLKDLKSSLSDADNIINKYSNIITRIKSQKADVIDKDVHIPFLKKIFFGRWINTKNACLIKQFDQQIEQYSSEKNDAYKSSASLKEKINATKISLSNIQSQIYSKSIERDNIDKQKKALEKLPKAMKEWKKSLANVRNEGIQIEETDMPKLGQYDFYDKLDKFRAKLFALSVRYWEGKWLLETKQAIQKEEEYKEDEVSVKTRLRRRAMLTPCFVSTFHSAPKKLSYWDSEARQEKHLLDYIDCLIIDEAGQASPEISVALFALAKKAVVVGDVKQIEPVWSILNSVDNANLSKFNLVPNGFMDFKGRMCSCGSIMRIAQAACAVKDDSIDERGNILLEHRRCLPEIIEYCSKLAYNGKIISKREPEDTIFPQMAFFNVNSSTITKQGNKRSNPDESCEICKWLKENRQTIEDKYGPIEENVGILTPFIGQKEQICRDLNQNGFNAVGFKIGTVHALQGAERPIVLFSSVYTANDKVGKKFFDSNVNMLNVAVSRAKDSFILFGDERIFNNKETPSGKLFEIVSKKPLALSSKPLNAAKVDDMEYDVFISFSSKDQVVINEISTFLKSEERHLKVFMSRDDLKYNDAESFRVGLGRALQHSKLMLFILSNNFVRSPETRNEWNTGVDSLRLPKLMFQIDKTINWEEDDDNVRYFVSATGNGGQAIQAHDSIQENLPQLLREINEILGKKTTN